MVANTVNEENLKILRMIEDRKITAEQGALLLASGNKPAENTVVVAPKSGKTRWFRVLVTDTASDKVRVSVRLPLSLVKWGLKVGGHYAPEIEGIDMDELAEILNAEEQGKLVEVMDEEDGEHVQIFIE
jgi:hypothetical protein